MIITDLYNTLSIHMWLLNLVCAAVSWFISLRTGYKSPLIFCYFIGCALIDRMGMVMMDVYKSNWFISPVFATFEYFIWTRVFIQALSGRKPKYLWVFDLITVALCLWECYNIYSHMSYLLIPVRSQVYMIILLILIYNYVAFAPYLSESYIALYGILFVYNAFNMVVFMLYNITIHEKLNSYYLILFTVSAVYYIFYILLLINQWKIGKTRNYS